MNKILYLILLTILLSGCASMFKDHTKKDTVVVKQAQMVVAKRLFKQAKKCWATEYEEIRSAKELLMDVVSTILFDEDSVRTKTVIKSIHELDGIHILSFYQHDGLERLNQEQRREYSYSGEDYPIVKILITEISAKTLRVTIHQLIGYEEGHDAIKEVKQWLNGNNTCQSK